MLLAGNDYVLVIFRIRVGVRTCCRGRRCRVSSSAGAATTANQVRCIPAVERIFLCLAPGAGCAAFARRLDAPGLGAGRDYESRISHPTLVALRRCVLVVAVVAVAVARALRTLRLVALLD